jgi:hypothetical protein
MLDLCLQLLLTELNGVQFALDVVLMGMHAHYNFARDIPWPMPRARQMLSGGAASTAADAWSFGVLVYTLLAGFPPFFPREGGTQAELKEQARAHPLCHKYILYLYLYLFIRLCAAWTLLASNTWHADQGRRVWVSSGALERSVAACA